jgi:hypothetical protein
LQARQAPADIAVEQQTTRDSSCVYQVEACHDRYALRE